MADYNTRAQSPDASRRNAPAPTYLDIDALCSEAERAGEAWANAKAAASALKETLKTVLAKLTTDHLYEVKGVVSKAELFALGHPKYEKHIEAMVAASRAADIAKIRFDLLNTRIELLRTNSATERAALYR